MAKRIETLKYTFTVEGETEQWYLLWLRDRINCCPERTYDVAIVPNLQQSPKKFFKGVTAKATPRIFHVCDVESNEQIHVDKFHRILSEMKEAREQKGITYTLGYSNFTFELWMILHKADCNGMLNHRKQYLAPLNKAYAENFEDLKQYKHEDNFKRCLGKLSLEDVREAIRRSEAIMSRNEKAGNPVERYKGYEYYKNNPALSIHEIVKMILKDCGLL